MSVKGFTLSSGIGNIRHIERFLSVNKLSRNPVSLCSAKCVGIYSWGSKPYSVQSDRLARFFGLPHIRLEDGFICSYGNDSKHRKYSLVSDPTGIYYDATQPSRLENILNGLDTDSWRLSDPGYIGRAQRLIQRLIENEVTKYNTVEKAQADLSGLKGYVLVIDQTDGDQSVRLGGMNAERFSAMLRAAIREHTRDKVFLKVHPEVMAGRKQGYLAELATSLGVKTITGEIPVDKLSDCAAVYVGTSLYGMEALLRGVPVICYGQPFYSGWGVTRDIQPLPRRTAPRTVAEIFIASYLLYANYIDPISAQPCELEEIIDHIAVQAEQRRRVGKTYTCVGITPWKRRYIDKYLLSADFGHRHISIKKQLGVGGDSVAPELQHYLVWGKKKPDTPLEKQLIGRSVARMEDGFVRSVGLGSNFTAPRSLVIDDLGIYFDATQPSRMEHLLQHYDCSSSQENRASDLIDILTEQRISKYVSFSTATEDSSFYRGKKALLVIGQVDGDASLRFGTTTITSNLQLLSAVKQRNPNRMIVYKPHPDVVSGNRSDGIDNYCEVSALCDHVETSLPIDTALRLCEEIHTMTSLAGLEALLCGKKVVTYGRPFYAGWGLTEDLCAFERRSRIRTLQELVYISYIHYPAYLDIASGEFTTVEKTISALIFERERIKGSMTATGLKKYVNIFHNIRKGLTYAA